MKLRKIFVGGFIVSLIFGANFHGETAQKIVALEGDAKQEYIAKKTQPLFHPKPSEVVEKKSFVVPKGWSHEKFSVGEVSVEKLTEKNSKNRRVILQLHGGGYVKGMDDSYRTLGAEQAQMLNAREIFFVDYRLAPENKYPAALEDAVAVYENLLAQGIKSENIIVIGDSAGGNLTLELSLYLKENKKNQPGALILVSPWATFEHKENSSRFTNKEKDLILGEKGAEFYHELPRPTYADGMDYADPKLSPIYADLSGLPPMLIQVGSYELFLDEGISLLEKASQDGVTASLTVYPGMPHDFALLLPEMKESSDSQREIKDFVNRYVK